MEELHPSSLDLSRRNTSESSNGGYQNPKPVLSHYSSSTIERSSSLPSSSASSSSSSSSSTDPGNYVAEALTKSGILDPQTARAYGSLFSRFMLAHSTHRNIRNNGNSILNSNNVYSSASAGVHGVYMNSALNMEWERIKPPGSHLVKNYEDMELCPEDIPLQIELLNKIAIVKLNGGLGTTMGCQGPKSAIPVRGGLSFLDLTVRQIEYINTKWGCDVPLILMNSFRTHDATVKLLSKYQHHNVTITCFTQSCFPRIDRDHFTPLPTGPFTPADEQTWYPPGHGDIYRALQVSGVLDSLLDQGKEYIFISNVDNLGATADLRILYHLISNDIDFAMEVTERTRSDIQGGILIEYVPPTNTNGSNGGIHTVSGNNGNNNTPGTATHSITVPQSSQSLATNSSGNDIHGSVSTLTGYTANSSSSSSTGSLGYAKLLELGQVPEEHTNEFKSLKRFTCFNTNNLWVNLQVMKTLVTNEQIAPPVIITERHVNGTHVIELETAAGAAIEFFTKALGILVPRSRFLPVKSTSDLLAVQSNLYDIRHGRLVMSSKREVPTPPVIKLGPEFNDLDSYLARIPSSSIPDLLELDHLTVSGDVRFHKGIHLSGTVIIVANEGSRIDLPPGSILENKVITGNLRILEH